MRPQLLHELVKMLSLWGKLRTIQQVQLCCMRLIRRELTLITLHMQNVTIPDTRCYYWRRMVSVLF